MQIVYDSLGNVLGTLVPLGSEERSILKIEATKDNFCANAGNTQEGFFTDKNFAHAYKASDGTIREYCQIEAFDETGASLGLLPVTFGETTIDGDFIIAEFSAIGNLGKPLVIGPDGKIVLGVSNQSKGDHKVNVSMPDGSWLETNLEYDENSLTFEQIIGAIKMVLGGGSISIESGNAKAHLEPDGSVVSEANDLKKSVAYGEIIKFSIDGGTTWKNLQLVDREGVPVFQITAPLMVESAVHDIDAPQWGQVKTYARSLFYRAGYNTPPTSMVFTKANRTLSLVNAENFLFVKNLEVQVPLNDSKSIEDVEGYWYFYYNESGALVSTQSKPSNFYFEYASVAIVYWNAVNKEAEVVIPCWYQVQFAAKGERFVSRFTTRKQYSTGLSPANLVTEKTQSTVTDDDLKFTVTNGITIDGNVPSLIDAFSIFPAQIPVGFLSGPQANPVIRTKVTNTFPLHVNTDTGLIQYNPIVGGNYGLSDVPSGNFVLYTYFQLDTMPSDGLQPLPVVFGVPSSSLYTSVALARDAIDDEVSRLFGYDVISQHSVPLFTLIVESSTTNTGTYNARYRDIDTNVQFFDLRKTKGTGGTSSVATNNHELLNFLYGGAPLDHYHITGDQHLLLTGGAETTLHKHGLQQVMDTSNSFEKIGSSASQRFYRANGTISVKTPVLLGQEPMKIEAYTYGTTGYGATAQGKIAFWSTENNTDAAKGMEYRIYVTKNGTVDMLCPIRVRHNGVMEYYSYTGSMTVTRADRFNNGVKTIPAIEDIVWATLTGLTVGTDTQILATDSILSAFANMQAQMDARIRNSEKGQPNGVATLDSNGKIPTAQLPSIAITDTFTVSSESAMLALTAETGDIAIRVDVNETYVLSALPASTLANWKKLLTPTDYLVSTKYKTVTALSNGSTYGISNANGLLYQTTGDISITLSATGLANGDWFDLWVSDTTGSITINNSVQKKRKITYRDGFVRVVYSSGLFFFCGGTGDSARSVYPQFGTNYTDPCAHVKRGIGYGATNAGITISAPTAIVGVMSTGVESVTNITFNTPDLANTPERQVSIDTLLRDYDGALGTQTVNLIRSGTVTYDAEVYIKELVTIPTLPVIINVGAGVKLYYENKSNNITFSGVVTNVSNKYWSKNPIVSSGEEGIISAGVRLCDYNLTQDNSGYTPTNTAYQGGHGLANVNFTAKQIQFLVGSPVGGSSTYELEVYEMSAIVGGQTAKCVASKLFTIAGGFSGVHTEPLAEFQVTKGKFYSVLLRYTGGASVSFLGLPLRTIYGVCFSYRRTSTTLATVGDNNLLVTDNINRFWFSIEG